jgi:hypothetical protein
MAQIVKVYFDQLRQAWSSPIVPRKLAGEASGRTVSPKSLANMDCAGEGPEGAFKIGGAMVYPAESFFDWLEARARPVERKKKQIPDELLS